MAIDSPVLGVLDKVGKGIKAASKISFTDDYTDSDVSKAWQGAYVALQAAALEVPKVGVALNAGLGFARPLVEKSFYPTQSQADKTYLGR